MKKSVCCDARLIGGVQCETCGADGREFEKRETEEEMSETFRQEKMEEEEKEKINNLTVED